MRKYIDADELKKVFRDTEDAEYARWTLAGVIGEIDDIEAADVVEKEKYDRLLENSLIVSSALQKYQKADVEEVVRCKECKYWNRDALCCTKEIHYIVNAEENDYCSYGERKDG